MNRFKHAFALDDPNVEPTDDQKKVVEKVCREVVRRGLATPALLSLEMFRPLNYVAAQGMHFLQPIVKIVLDGEGYRHLSEFLEHRGSVDYMRERIEALEDQGSNKNARKEAEDGRGEPQEPSS